MLNSILLMGMGVMIMEQPQPFRKKKRISDKNLSLSRKIRDYAILAKGDMPIEVSEEEFLIPSQSSDKKLLSSWHLGLILLKIKL